jgi:outer membrane protein TolC
MTRLTPHHLVTTRRALVLLTSTAAVACISYRPVPLPPGLELSPAPELALLAVAAAELAHPILAPLTVDLDDGLSPDEAAVLAVLANPDLAALRLTHDEAAAQLVLAGLLPAPSLSHERDHPYGSGAAGTVNTTNLGLELDLGGLIGRSAEVAQAGATLAGVDLGIAWQEWQVAQAARLAAVRCGWLARRIAIVDDELRSGEDALEALQAALELGDATLSDVGVKLAAVEALRRARGELRRSEIEARGELARLLGLGNSAELHLVLDVDPNRAVELPADDLVATAVDGRLDLLALRRVYDAQEAAVRQAVLAQLPSLSVGVVRQRNESALKFLGGYVTLGLPFLGQPRAAIRREEATRTRLGDELTARCAAIAADVRTLVTALGELEAQLDDARAAVGRLAPVAAAASDAAASGDIDRLAEEVVRTAFADARLAEAALEQARAETLVGLATAVGRPLSHPAAAAHGDTP